MKILLTGPNGNLGTSLRRLGSKNEFVSLAREDWGDLKNRIKGVDVVVHAASDLTTPVRDAPVKVLDSNLVSTARLLEALPEGVRFVFVSSCAVYGRSQITREDVEPHPISVNGITKLLNEKVVTAFARAHGTPIQILRVFNIFGGDDHFSILAHARRALEGQRPFVMNNGGISQRDFVAVDDVARIILGLLEKPIRHEILNVGSGRAVRIGDVVDVIRAKHPELQTKTADLPEAEYSRADLTRLREIFPDYGFKSVLEYVRESF